MKTIQEIENEIIEEFAIYDDWMDKYAYLIEIGNDLPGMDEAHKTEDNLIQGCQSRVWFHAEMKDGRLGGSGKRTAESITDETAKL